MARRAEATEPPAPDGFWVTLKRHHDELWRAPEVTHKRRLFGLLRVADDQWLHPNPEDETLGVGALWRTRRIAGGLLLGSLDVTSMSEADMATITDVSLFDAPTQTTHFRYVIPKPGSRHSPTLSVNRQMHTPSDLRVPLSPLSGANIQAIDRWIGLQVPTPGDYRQVLAEMAVGASGRFRIPPELR